jgi:hypothetical protein
METSCKESVKELDCQEEGASIASSSQNVGFSKLVQGVRYLSFAFHMSLRRKLYCSGYFKYFYKIGKIWNNGEFIKQDSAIWACNVFFWLDSAQYNKIPPPLDFS